jgi:4-amino-4-deoxychorismate synthase (2-amino-4-deoxychorismate-forming) component I
VQAPAVAQVALRADPFQLFLGLRQGQPRAAFLDSGAAGGPNARWSYLAAGDFPVLQARVGAGPLDLMRTALGPRRARWPGLPPFQGGFVGVLGYDLARDLEALPRSAPDVLRAPALWGMVVDEFLAADLQTQRLYAIALPRAGEDGKETELRCQALLDRAHARATVPAGKPADAQAASDAGEAGYVGMVKAGKRLIDAGHVYQVNLAHRLTWPSPAEPLWLYGRLRRVNPSPFAFYLDSGDWQLVSSSPERLLRVQGREVETRPIAGTYPRAADPREDEAQASRLRSDPKERAEHTMLVDLERNDLGRCCTYGSVRVDEFLTTERYSHVVHLVSRVVGELGAGNGALDAVRACFPGGTITGVPKVRAMEVIEELEPARRAFYTGSAGWLGFTGDADLNIVIRTLLLQDGEAHAHVGAGIVADSDPQREWRETLHKARALLQAAGSEAP